MLTNESKVFESDAGFGTPRYISHSIRFQDVDVHPRFISASASKPIRRVRPSSAYVPVHGASERIA